MLNLRQKCDLCSIKGLVRRLVDRAARRVRPQARARLLRRVLRAPAPVVAGLNPAPEVTGLQPSPEITGIVF